MRVFGRQDKKFTQLVFFSVNGMAKWNGKYSFQTAFALLLVFVLSQFNERFSGQHEIVASLCTLLPHCFGKITFEDLKPAVLIYEKFFIGDILDSMDDSGAEFKL